MCRKSVSRNALVCKDCKVWVHINSCGDVWGSLLNKKRLNSKGVRDRFCTVPFTESRVKTVSVESLEILIKFCCLGDTLSTGGGVKGSSVAMGRNGWKKYGNCWLHILLVFLMSTKGNLFDACVRVLSRMLARHGQ